MRQQTQVHEYRWEQNMRQLSSWMDEQWRHGMHRFVSAGAFLRLQSTRLGIDIRGLDMRQIDVHCESLGVDIGLFIQIPRWQTSTSALQTTVDATANVLVPIRRVAEHVVTALQAGPIMERRAAQVCVD